MALGAKARNILSRVGNRMGSRGVIGTAAVGAGILGLGASLAPTARDAAFESIMGDPNADVAFTGRKIDTRYLVGRSMGGFTGRALQYSAPTDTFTFQGPGAVNPRNTAAISATLGSIGFAGGAMGAAVLASKRGKSLKGKIGFGILGGITGGSLGAAMGPTGDLLQTRQLMKNNQTFYDQSPYATRNSTRSLIHSTNAVGDIVLGMHNSRGGY